MEMEDEGQKIIKLNLGTLAVLALIKALKSADMICAPVSGAGQQEHFFNAQKRMMRRTRRGIKGVTLDGICLGGSVG
jgi:alanine-synthesizing transaminase